MGAPGNSYRAGSSTNFLDWNPITSALAINGTARITALSVTSRGLRFYRTLDP